MAIDTFSSLTSGLLDPCTNADAVTTSDTVDLTHVSRYIYVGGAGDITLVTSKGDTVLLKAVPIGAMLPIRASKIKLTGTTATNLVALY